MLATPEDTITGYLIRDHQRLHALLDAAVRFPGAFDAESFEAFREGLLTHIAIEEKILLPQARKRRAGEPIPEAHALRIDHAALTSLLVPSPDAALVIELRSILDPHDAQEEGEHGVYAGCERLFGDDSAALAERASAYPTPRMAPHYDGPGSVRTAAEALASARRIAPPRRRNEPTSKAPG